MEFLLLGNWVEGANLPQLHALHLMLKGSKKMPLIEEIQYLDVPLEVRIND